MAYQPFSHGKHRWIAFFLGGACAFALLLLFFIFLSPQPSQTSSSATSHGSAEKNVFTKFVSGISLVFHHLPLFSTIYPPKNTTPRIMQISNAPSPALQTSTPTTSTNTQQAAVHSEYQALSNRIGSLEVRATTPILLAGKGIGVAGLKISNTDVGSAQYIFKNIAVSGQANITAATNNDTLTLAAGSGIDLGTNTSEKKLTISAQAVDLGSNRITGTLGIGNGGTGAASFTQYGILYGNGAAGLSVLAPGSAGYLLSTNDTGSAPSWIAASSLSAGSIAFSGITSETNTQAAMLIGSGESLSYTGTGTINANQLLGATWTAPNAIGATTANTGAFTTLSGSGAITFSSLGSGVVHSNSSGVLSSSALNLAGGATEVNGSLGVGNGGTGVASLASGSLVYGAGGIAAFNTLGIGAANTVLTSSGSAPQWSSSLSLGGTLNVSGLLTASSGLTIPSGQTLTLSSLTAGSIPFINSSLQLAQDNTNLFWDQANNRLGIGRNAPLTTLDVNGSASVSGSMTIKGPNPYVDVKAFGAKGDGVNDDTAAFQAAIDYAQTFVTSSTNAPQVFIPPGRRNISNTITLKSASIIGTGPNNSVRIFWNGSSSATAFVKSTAFAGGTSFGLIQEVEFLKGTAEPATWLDLTAGVVDVMYQLDRVHFSGGADQIKIASWVNLHWTNLRFDNWTDYAIYASPAASMNLSDFSISDFTADHHSSSGAANGFIYINDTADATNMGTFYLAHGRIEINTAFVNQQALISLGLKSSPSATRSLGLHLSDISYSDNSTMANDVLFYRDTTNTTGSEYFLFDNIRTSGLSAILGGTWPSNFPLPPVPANGIITHMASQGTNAQIASTQNYYSRVSTDLILNTQLQGDTNDRLDIDASGKHTWGSGTATGDTNLYRSTASTLKTDSTFVVGTVFQQLGTGNSYFTGNLGIGTTSPVAKLDIRGNAGTSPIASFSGSTAKAGLIIDNSGSGDLFTASSSGLSRFVITQSGNVGIGTTNPTATLSVAGTLTASGLLTANGGATVASGQTLTLAGITGNNAVLFATAGTGVIDSATTNSSNLCLLSGASSPTWGSYSAGTNFWQINGNVLAPLTTSNSLSIGTTNSLGTLDVRALSGTLAVASISGQTSFAGLVIDSSGSGDLFAASSSGRNRLVITQNGNVGIGTTAPANTLDVNGTLRASSTSNSIFGNGTTGGIQIGDGTLTKTSWNCPASTDTFSLRCDGLFHCSLLIVNRALIA